MQIAPLSPDDLQHSQAVTRTLFERSVAAFTAGKSPQDEIALDVSHERLGKGGAGKRGAGEGRGGEERGDGVVATQI